MRTRWVVAVLLVMLVALGAAFALVSRTSGEREAITEHPVTIPKTARTVGISTAMPAPSASARRLSAMLEEGVMPTGRVMAEVLSDTECTPNTAMISRCRNEMRLPDGSTIVVRHSHDMRQIPCLAPGERVLLVPST